MSKEQNINFLVEMGFPRELAAKAIASEGYIEPAIEYCMKHVGGQALGSGDSSGGGSGGVALGGSLHASERRERDDDDDMVVESKPSVADAPPPKQMTEEEKAEALRKIQERIKERKEAAAKAEEMSELEKEKFRRLEGQEAQKTREEYEKKKADREAYLRKKAKEDDKKARDAILAKLEQDRINREAELAKKSGAAAATHPPAAQATAPATEPERPAEHKIYDECVLQIRLPDNSKLQHTFKPTDTMQAVISFIRANSIKYKNANLTLSTTFPRKVYSGASLSTTLQDAELVPRGMLVVNTS